MMTVADPQDERTALRRSLQAFAAGAVCAYCDGRLTVRRQAVTRAHFVVCMDCRTPAEVPPAALPLTAMTTTLP
jgi:hypothetical protein